MKERKRIIILFSLVCALFILLNAPNALARRGCCSHHGGVASCDTSAGSLVCRDGSYSPTCGCEFRLPQTQKKKKDTATSSAEQDSQSE